MSQVGDFDQDVKIGNVAFGRQQSVAVNEDTVKQDFKVIENNISSIVSGNGNSVNAQTLENCLNEMIDGEMGNLVGTVEDTETQL